MRFSRSPAMSAPKVKFGQRPQADALPMPHVAKEAARRTASLAQAADALAVLPGPEEAVHTLLTGRFDLMHMIVCIIDRLGTVDNMRIATLSYNRRNLSEMLALLDNGRVQKMTLLCSKFFAEHNKTTYQLTLEEFRKRGQRAAAARSHAKIVTLAFTSGQRLTATGSSNLRQNGNIENLLLADGADVHDWYAGWVDDKVSQHEGQAVESTSTTAPKIGVVRE